VSVGDSGRLGVLVGRTMEVNSSCWHFTCGWFQ